MEGYGTPEKACSPRAGGAGRSGYAPEEHGKSSGVPIYGDKCRRWYIKKKGAAVLRPYRSKEEAVAVMRLLQQKRDCFRLSGFTAERQAFWACRLRKVGTSRSSAGTSLATSRTLFESGFVSANPEARCWPW